MIASSSDPGHHRRLPPDRFFWGVLRPVTAGLRKKPTIEQLGYLFEQVLPVPIDEVQAAYHRQSDGRWIACGMKRSELADELTGTEVTLTPSHAPAFLTDMLDELRTDDLNLLTEDFEPAPVRTWNRRCTMAAAGLVALLSSGLTSYLYLQERAASSEMSQVYALQMKVFEQALGHGFHRSDATSAQGQPPELRLLAELRQLRRTRQPNRDVINQPDAAEHLVRLLGMWPSPDEALHLADESPPAGTLRTTVASADPGVNWERNAEDMLYVRTEVISITPQSMNVRALIPTANDAERLAAALRATPGWMLSQPQISSTRDAVQASLRFTLEAISAEDESS